MGIINLEHINELKSIDEDGSNSTLKELIGMYKDSSKKKLEELKVLFKNQDLDNLRKVAHALRSSSLNLGAVSFPEVLQRIEYFTDTGTLPDNMKLAEVEYQKFLEALSQI